MLLKRVAAFVYGNYIWENNHDYIGTMWFLVCLFCMICLSWLLHRIKSEKVRLAVTAAVALFGEIFSKLLVKWGIRLPWCSDIALVAICFYTLGQWWRQHRKHSGGRGLLAGCILLPVGFGLSACNLLWCTPKTDMLPIMFGSVSLFLTGASLICLGLVLVVSNLYGCRRFKLIEYAGRQSLAIMIVHYYILSVVAFLSNRFIPGISGWLWFLLITALSVFAAFIVDKKLPFLNDFRYVKKSKCK